MSTKEDADHTAPAAAPEAPAHPADDVPAPPPTPAPPRYIPRLLRDLKYGLEWDAARDVRYLDPSDVTQSFINDRLPSEDEGFEEFKDGIRDQGQLVPILVRPHPSLPGKFEIASGRRRLKACLLLGRSVKAHVAPLTNDELLVAQGKHNTDRIDCSYIEKVFFALAMLEHGTDRAVAMAALSVADKDNFSKLLKVARSVPLDLVELIGPAPKTGRRRWKKFVGFLKERGGEAANIVASVTSSEEFQAASSDGRFSLLLDALEEPPALFMNSKSKPAASVERSAGATRIMIDEKAAPQFGEFLVARLAALLQAYEAEVTAKR